MPKDTTQQLAVLSRVSQEYPAIRAMPKEGREVVGLKAFGLSNVTIGKVLGVDESTVRNRIKLYDPDGAYVLSPDTQKAFVAYSLFSLMGEALAGIDPKDIGLMNAKERMAFVKTAASVVKDLDYAKAERERDVRGILNSLDAATKP